MLTLSVVEESTLDDTTGSSRAIIRHGPLLDDGWIARRFAPSGRILVASPDYLKSIGTPQGIQAQMREWARRAFERIHPRIDTAGPLHKVSCTSYITVYKE
jgi:hypothetical protein